MELRPSPGFATGWVAAVADASWVTLALGVGTILASGVTSAFVTSRLNRSKERFEFLRGKAETLYLAVDQFVKVLGQHALTYYPVLRGEMDWNQMLDLQIARGSDSGRHEGAEVMEMLVELYFPAVRPTLDELFAARDGFNRITHAMRRDYKRYGKVPVQEHGAAFQTAVELINERGDALQRAVVKTARATVGTLVGR